MLKGLNVIPELSTPECPNKTIKPHIKSALLGLMGMGRN